MRKKSISNEVTLSSQSHWPDALGRPHRPRMLLPLIAVAAGCFVLERAHAGWKLPNVRTWPVRVIVINAVQIGVVLIAGVTWETYARAYSVMNLSDHVSPALGGFIAYFVATFVFYWWHRLRHRSDFFWRMFHQIHHSPQRLEVITSFYKHPLEMVVNSILGSLIVYTLLGLSPSAGAVYTAFTALGEFFYHTNVRTPRWVGYVFQRPEMHRIHHEKNKHRNNYGDIVWWDMLFGTYSNPPTWDATCGFTPEREEKLGAMLAFKDVHKKKTGVAASLVLVLACGGLSACTAKHQWSRVCDEAEELVADTILTPEQRFSRFVYNAYPHMPSEGARARWWDLLHKPTPERYKFMTSLATQWGDPTWVCPAAHAIVDFEPSPSIFGSAVRAAKPD